MNTGKTDADADVPTSTPESVDWFAPALIHWQSHGGRHDLPWQGQTQAYRVWLSEIMLQQTQVATVIPYYRRFLDAFGDVTQLADATSEQVMSLWSGLGYYSRARNLHRCAQLVACRERAEFPCSLDELQQLPGIGRSTAAAIMVFAFNRRAAILDGNVKRVLARCFAIDGLNTSAPVVKKLWAIADACLPTKSLKPYTQGLMDLGALVCTRSKPRCDVCPFADRCMAFHSNRVDELPTKKAKKTNPLRRTTMLLLVREQNRVTQIMLAQRPDTGIWGGLLSLPESGLAHGAASESHLLDAGHPSLVPWLLAPDDGERRFRVDPDVLKPFTHVFSHFNLRIEPRLMRMSDSVPPFAAQDDALRWLDLTDIADAPLPRPVKTLLAELARNASLA